MFLLISVLLFFPFQLCSSQEDVGCDGKENCNDLEVTGCIADYAQLDLYILTNKTLLRKFTETFFQTGESTSQFVKFTYNFQVSNTSSNLDNDLINCTSHSTTFIWSTSVLYLLGPRPLFWLTLFAVNIPEASAAIELPCLCSDAYSDLLARLTYLVCVY